MKLQVGGRLGSSGEYQISIFKLTERRMLTGHIEIANPRLISGWAQDPHQPDAWVRLVITSNGEQIGSVLANRFRSDLQQAGIGNGDHEFSFELTADAISSETHVVQILRESDGTELPGSPIVLRASQSFEAVSLALKGSIDFVDLEKIAGWTRDELRPDTAVPLLISDHDEIIGRVVADIYREDLKDAGIGNGHHAFEFPMSLDPSKAHVIRVRRESDGTEVPGSPVTLGLPEPEESTVERLTGSIDAVNLSKISGWARDVSHPDQPVSLLITNNDEFLGRLLANGYREDLKLAGVGNGRFSFDFEFPNPLPAFENHVIRVMRESDGAELPGSPLRLRASQSFDAATQESLARALDQCGSNDDLPRKIDFLVSQVDRLLQQNADAQSLRADRERYRRLLQRWKSQPQDKASVAVSVSPASFLRALVIDERLPKPDRDAGSNAILSHILSLQRLGYQVTIVPAVDFDPSAAERLAIEAIGVSCCCSPYYGSVEEVLRRQAGEFDVVYLHRVSNASKYGELVTSHFPKARRIYSVADLYHIRLLRQAAVEDRPELAAFGKRIRLAEFTAAAFSNAVITHSNSEAAILKSQVPGASIFTIPWSVGIRPTKVPFASRSGFAFIGGFGHAPNQDAVRWLIKDIMPLLRSRDPSIKCYLVGSDMPDQFRQFADAGIVPVGHVENLAEIFDQVRLTVAPLAYGAGLKGKVIESLSAGVPCVCTTVAAEGFDLPAPLRECIADDPEAIAASILRLHNTKAENERCRRAGLQFITAEFSEGRLDTLMGEALGLNRKKPEAQAPEGKPSEAKPSEGNVPEGSEQEEIAKGSDKKSKRRVLASKPQTLAPRKPRSRPSVSPKP